MYDTGIFNSGSVSYTGKGTSVAVLDSGFDLSHPVFSTMPDVEDDKLTVTRDSVSAVLASSNAAKTTEGLEIKDVYVNTKIPYAYDYADKDYDVFPYDSEHGTHVAGIIGGKTPDSAKTETEQGIIGVAVDTQIVCMKVFPDLSEGGKTEDIIAAVEDAVLLNVDAINMVAGFFLRICPRRRRQLYKRSIRQGQRFRRKPYRCGKQQLQLGSGRRTG